MFLQSSIKKALYRYTVAPANLFLDIFQSLLLITKRFMELCRDKGIMDHSLNLPLKNNISPDFTKKMLIFSDHKFKKAYISTMGDFSVSPYKKREEPIKMRTKKRPCQTGH
jgi:hypothetical protein